MGLELILLGIVVGILSGFFGIGGGTILVPLLLFIGFDIKTAIGISVVQMVFSSLFGSYINSKRGTLDIKMVLTIGLGGFVGALASSMIVKTLSAQTLELIFIGFVAFALTRLYFKTLEHGETRHVHPIILFIIGAVLGAFSISIGVGGSILLVPLLVGFLHVPLKNAIAAGLFFVIFSSVSGLISLSVNGTVDYVNGSIIGIASLIGVYGGIWLKHKTTDTLQKRLLVIFYIVILSYLIYRLVVHHG
ncbi:MAG: sulfite exporter TauE/SafE family protein [Campylobacterota bacterium]|nr:sulfite exporter TauE/SafE family protein [Campylobacterota bacterium]